jgi:hypothetical protein
MLPKPKDKHGYTTEEIDLLCQKYKISRKKFSNAFGINTCMIAKDGTVRYYRVDVERALWKLGIKDGKYHEWD